MASAFAAKLRELGFVEEGKDAINSENLEWVFVNSTATPLIRWLTQVLTERNSVTLEEQQQFTQLSQAGLVQFDSTGLVGVDNVEDSTEHLNQDIQRLERELAETQAALQHSVSQREALSREETQLTSKLTSLQEETQRVASGVAVSNVIFANSLGDLHADAWQCVDETLQKALRKLCADPDQSERADLWERPEEATAYVRAEQGFLDETLKLLANDPAIDDEVAKATQEQQRLTEALKQASLDREAAELEVIRWQSLLSSITGSNEDNPAKPHLTDLSAQTDDNIANTLAAHFGRWAELQVMPLVVTQLERQHAQATTWIAAGEHVAQVLAAAVAREYTLYVASLAESVRLKSVQASLVEWQARLRQKVVEALKRQQALEQYSSREANGTVRKVIDDADEYLQSLDQLMDATRRPAGTLFASIYDLQRKASQLSELAESSQSELMKLLDESNTELNLRQTACSLLNQRLFLDALVDQPILVPLDLATTQRELQSMVTDLQPLLRQAPKMLEIPESVMRHKPVFLRFFNDPTSLKTLTQP